MKRRKMYNWHFWIPKYKIQVIIDDTNYCRAVKKINSIFNVNHREYPINVRIKIEFQFGQIAF